MLPCLLIGTKRSPPSAAQGPLENPRVHSYVAIPFVLAIVIVLVGNPTPTPSEAGLPLVPRVSHGTAETDVRRSRRRQCKSSHCENAPFQQEFHPLQACWCRSRAPITRGAGTQCRCGDARSYSAVSTERCPLLEIMCSRVSIYEASRRSIVVARSHARMLVEAGVVLAAAAAAQMPQRR